jgi:basic membrane protein A and related proteins
LRVSRRLAALGAAVAMVAAACSGGATTAPSQAPEGTSGPTQAASVAPSASSFKACVAFDTGGLGDKGFNDLAQKGLQDFGALGYQTAFSEAQSSTDYAANIQRLLDQNCNAIVTVGFNQSDATAKAAADNPTIAFAQVDTSWNACGPDFVCGNADDTPQPKNFTGLDYQVDQAAMLAGDLAAGWSKTGKIGTYGGQAFAGVTRYMDGLYAGIQYYNKLHSTNVTLLGWDGNKTGTFINGSNPWNDPAKGEQLAKQLFDQNVDVIHPVAGATGNGSIKAAAAAGKWAIGVDNDQALTLPEYASAILTSAQKAIDVSVLDFFKSAAAGNLGGKDYEGTLANNGVLLSPFHSFDSQIPAALKAEIQTLHDAIVSGSVKVCQYLARGC